MRKRLAKEWDSVAALATLRDRGFPDPVSQLVELRRQLPSLYILLIINITAVSYTHYGLAPPMLTVTIPVILSTICGVRAVHWLRARNVPGRAEALADLRRVTFLSFAISAFAIVWAIGLDGYGHAYAQAHVAFFIAVTVIGCIFCLTQLPQAAFLVAATVLAPYVAYYSLTGRPVFVAMAINFTLVTIVIGQVTVKNFRAFVDLRTSRRELAEEQAQSRALSQANARLANTDSLTNLPNRRAFLARLDSCAAAAGGTEATFALMLIDLDGFKPINDGHGHVVGDRVLAEVGRLLLSLCDNHVVAARLGGDEFALLVVGDASPDAMDRFGRLVCETLSAPMSIDDLNLDCRASCGIAIHTAAAPTAADLYDRADFALYDAKANRRGGAMLFNDQHAARLNEDRAIEAALLAADPSRDVDVQFRAIIDLEDGRSHGMEALARWTHPTLARVEPDRLARAATKTGIARRLTVVLLRKALAAMAGRPGHERLYVHLSAADITSAETVLGLIASIRRDELDPSRIVLQIAETVVMRDVALASRHLATLRSAGIRIALDDFGHGQSSLSCLRDLPLDEVMLHRSFAQGLATKPGASDVVRAVVELCRTLELGCIVKGVEDDAQCDAVTSLGGRLVQISRPGTRLAQRRLALRPASGRARRAGA